MIGLLALYQESPEAVEYDLIRHGERWRNLGGSLSWRDLKVILEQMPPSDSATWIRSNPDNAWSLESMLSAEMVDTLRMLFWAKTKDGSKNRNRPKPVERPGRRPERIGGRPLELAEMDAWLSRTVSFES